MLHITSNKQAPMHDAIAHLPIKTVKQAFHLVWILKPLGRRVKTERHKLGYVNKKGCQVPIGFEICLHQQETILESRSRNAFKD